MTVSRGLARLCAFVRALAVLGAVAAVAIPAWVWTSAERVESLWRSAGNIGNEPMTIDARAMALGGLVSLLPIGLTLFMLLQVWRLFGEYAQGRAISRPAQRHLNGFAAGVMALAVAQPFVRTLLTLVLTLGNGEGQRLISINLSGDDYLNVLVGAVLLAIARVMAEAVRVAEENAQFV